MTATLAPEIAVIALEDLDFEPVCEAFESVSHKTCGNVATWQMRHIACSFLLGIHCDEHHRVFQADGPRKLRCKGCGRPIRHLASETEVTPL